MKKLRILALNPFHGGSHKAFLKNWESLSHHEWTLLKLPGTQWRWRLQFAAVHFARLVKELYDKGQRWDIIFCTSMLNAAEFRGLTPFLTPLPLVVYFHENQLTYPLGSNVKFSLGRCMKNINSAFAADAVWFNSEFHKNDFLAAARKLLEPKPDSPVEFIDLIEDKASVFYQGIDDGFYHSSAKIFSNPIKLIWASRWEEDKNPGLLFRALKILKDRSFPFKLYVMGEEMGTRMSCFDEALATFKEEIEHFGFAESKEEYKRILQEGDLFISTADHEFFGVSTVEAVASGCLPVVPDHLAYPEVLADCKVYFYKPRSSVQLAEKVMAAGKEMSFNIQPGIDKYRWSDIAGKLDLGLVGVTQSTDSNG